MIVTEIVREKRHLVRVVCGGKSFLLDRDCAQEYSLKVGDELSDEKIVEMLKQSDYVRAKSRALWFLDRADHSEKALYDKLRRADISAEGCARAIARLKELGLIDDVRYAERLTERLMETNVSKREAYYKMTAKGLPADIVKQALEHMETDEVSQIKALIAKKYKSKLSLPQGNEKVAAALARKGFSYRAVRDALRAYCEDVEFIDGE